MKTKLLIIATAAALMGASVYAAPAATTTKSITGAPYIGAQIGFGGMQTPKLDANDGVIYNVGGVAGGVYGGYLFNMSKQFKLGAELGYKTYANNTYGDSNTAEAVYDGSYIDLLANAQYFFNDNFSLIGKAGLASVSQKETLSAVGLVTKSNSVSSVLPEVALGLGYKFNTNLGLNLTYNAVLGQSISEKDMGDLSNEKVVSVNTIMLGLNYSFA